MTFDPDHLRTLHEAARRAFPMSYTRMQTEQVIAVYLVNHVDDILALADAQAESERRLAEWDERLAERRHEIEFREDGWTIAHPLHERIEGSLFDCQRQWFDVDPGVRGRFYLEDNGSIGARLAAQTPPAADGGEQ